MKEAQLCTVAHLRAFLEGTLEVEFGLDSEGEAQRYGFIAAVLSRLSYRSLGRTDRGVVLRYLERTTGYSRQQLTRLVARHLGGAPLVKRYKGPVAGFQRKFSAADLAVLAQTDALHNTLSGPAMKYLMQRAYRIYGDVRYERLATLSVAHLYNLRKQAGYQAIRQHWTKTRGHAIPIAERRAPTQDSRPGFIRIDSVHQGDQDGLKGLYHINAVDALTQCEIVATCEQLSEACLLPVIRGMLEGFPFQVLGFHADNGSEYINYKVARLLEKLRIEFTRSRPRHSNDNGLAETKNGGIVRKYLGYSHIPQRFAALVNAFCQDFLNPYVNFHRPCFFPEITVDSKGKTRKRYRFENMMTPYEKLKSLPDAQQYLHPGVTFERLDAIANALSDNESARLLNEARAHLFLTLNRRSKRAA